MRHGILTTDKTIRGTGFRMVETPFSTNSLRKNNQ